MNRGSFELSVSIPREGRVTPLREFGHNGCTYVESREGQQFSLKFRNNTAHRVLAVPSIDCVSVLEGTPATPQSRGYIVPAYSQVEIKGWRTSLNDINNFIFERKESGKTYSEGTGNGTTNCGVIAVKVFSQKEKPKPQIIREEHHHHHHHNEYLDWPPIIPYPKPPWRPYWCSTTGVGGSGGNALSGSYTSKGGETIGAPADSSMIRCCMNNVSEPEYTSDQTLGTSEKYEGQVKKGLIGAINAAPAFNMGTGFGQHAEDRVSEELFERGAELALLEVYYTDAAALAEIGIDVNKKITVSAMPQSFVPGFCKAPVTR